MDEINSVYIYRFLLFCFSIGNKNYEKKKEKKVEC